MRAEFAARATWLDAEIVKRKKSRVAVLTAEGRGEVARAICTTAAIHSPKGGVDMYVPYDGTAAKHDMCAKAAEDGIITRMIPTPDLPRTIRLSALLRHYREVWDMCSVVPVCHDPYGHLRVAADYGDLYYGYPQANWRLKYLGEPWWEIASSILGMPVDPKLLAHAAPLDVSAEIDEATLPPTYMTFALDERCKGQTDNWERVELKGVPRYVVISTSAGAGSQVKCAPKDVWDAIAGHLERIDVRCVHVGFKTDGQPDCDVIDRRGTRLPLVNRLIKDSLCYIGNEGFLHYMAYGLQVPAVALYGPTPIDAYGFPGHLPLIRGDGKGHAACPLGTCFWAARENWGHECIMAGAYTRDPDGTERPVNPNALACINMPEPDAAAGAVGEFVMSRMGTYKDRAGEGKA